jgi:dTDP-4-amino-4,6-dideoxygalactose transaminase
MHIPFVDLRAQYQTIKSEVDTAMWEVIDACAFAGGPFVEAFEADFARFCGSKFAVGVSNGTEALWLALHALGIGPGDEVITVPNTFIATAEAISFCGARPVFVDVDENTYTMDPDLLESAITPRTKAVIPVHLFGQMAEMEPIMAVSGRHGLPVIEDASQAQGAEYKGKRAGSLGVAGCFSFYPSKNLGAFGEAGAVVTNDRELVGKLRLLRDHGQAPRYHHQVVGWNARMDGLQGAILKVKLRYLSAWNESRLRNALLYDSLLAGVNGIATPVTNEGAKHVFHVYAVRTDRRDALMKHLEHSSVGCGIHYPVPIHLQQAYAFLGLQKGSYPVAEKCAEELLSLPMYPELREHQVRSVVDRIKQFLAGQV